MVGDTTLGIENMCFGKLEILCDEECIEALLPLLILSKYFPEIFVSRRVDMPS